MTFVAPAAFDLADRNDPFGRVQGREVQDQLCGGAHRVAVFGTHGRVAAAPSSVRRSSSLGGHVLARAEAQRARVQSGFDVLADDGQHRIAFEGVFGQHFGAPPRPIPLRVGRFRKEYPRNSARRRAGAGCRRAPLRGCRARRRALRRSRNSTPRRSVRGWAGRRCRLAARRLAAGRRVLRFWPVRRFRRSDGRGCLPRGAPRR